MVLSEDRAWLDEGHSLTLYIALDETVSLRVCCYVHKTILLTEMLEIGRGELSIIASNQLAGDSMFFKI